jgi:hypothetical protein
MLPDDERLHALEAATVVVVPSPYESLSLLALEAFAVGTPVLANARAEVLVEHCLRSNAGLFYADRWEFVEALKLLMKDAALRTAMGENGKAYVHRHYRWTTILHKYERIFSRMGGQAPTLPARPPRRPRDRDRPREAAGSRDHRRQGQGHGTGDRPSRNNRDRDRHRRGGSRRDRPRDARSKRS